MDTEKIPAPSSAGTAATVAFIDLAGFSVIADAFEDAAAIDVLEIFGNMVRDALRGQATDHPAARIRMAVPRAAVPVPTTARSNSCARSPPSYEAAQQFPNEPLFCSS